MVPRKRLFWTNQKTNQKNTRSERNGKRERTIGTRPRARRAAAAAQARRLEAAARDAETARTELAAEREDAALLAKMNRNLETEVRSLLEKVVVLKDKSDHDDRLVDALRDETRRLRSASAEDSEAVSEVSERAGGFEPPESAAAVPLAEYRSMEARASSLEAKLRKQEQVALHARAQEREPRAALERAEKTRRDAEEEAAFSPAAVAAAAGGGEPPLGAGARFDADVANLIEHSETLERVCQEMKGKLVVAEKQVAQLREQVQAERRKYQDATRRMESVSQSDGDGRSARRWRSPRRRRSACAPSTRGGWTKWSARWSSTRR